MLKRIYYSLIAALLFFSRHFLTVGDPSNAFYHNQTLYDFGFVLASCALFFILISASFYLMEKFFNKYYNKFVFAALFISALPLMDFLGLAILRDNLAVQPGINRIIYPLFTLLYAPLIILIAVRFKVEKFLNKIIIIFSMVSLVVAFHVPPGYLGIQQIENKLTGKAKTPVFIMIFDAMSFEVLNAPELKGYFPNFIKLKKEYYFFNDAHSPGHNTIHSIPAMLTGIEYKNCKRFNLRLLISKSGENIFKDLPTQNSIFRLALRHEYNTVLVGNVLPYCSLFEKDLTLGYVRPYTAGLQEVFPLAFSAILNITPLAARDNAAQTFNKSFSMIENAPDNTLFFLHFPVPHYPFVFDVQGFSHNYWAFILKGGAYDYTQRYIKQLQYADKKLGEIIGKLKDREVYDKSLIIILADHNHPTDFGGQRDMTKIPLYIKKPFQEKGYFIKKRFDMINLKRFLASFFNAGIIDIEKLKSREML